MLKEAGVCVWGLSWSLYLAAERTQTAQTWSRRTSSLTLIVPPTFPSPLSLLSRWLWVLKDWFVSFLAVITQEWHRGSLTCNETIPPRPQIYLCALHPNSIICRAHNHQRTNTRLICKLIVGTLCTCSMHATHQKENQDASCLQADVINTRPCGRHRDSIICQDHTSGLMFNRTELQWWLGPASLLHNLSVTCLVCNTVCPWVISLTRVCYHSLELIRFPKELFITPGEEKTAKRLYL